MRIEGQSNKNYAVSGDKGVKFMDNHADFFLAALPVALNFC